MLILYSLFILLLSGCGAKFFSAETIATYKAPNGTEIKYQSTKEQQNLKFNFDPKSGEIRLSVEHSNTQDAAINAAIQNQLIQSQLLRDAINKAGNFATVP